MKNLLYFLTILGLISSCATKNQEGRLEPGDTATVASEDAGIYNQLTEQQKADGWKLLFNGQNLDGWKFYKDKPATNWTVVDNSLHSKSNAGAFADIMTVDKYENFELQFDFKVSPKGNSGVMYRVTEEFDEPYLSGPEYQVLDDNGWPGQLKDSQKSASNYDMHAAPQDNVKPAGEWNTGKIVVNGNHVEHWVNGAKVVEYDFDSNDWKLRKENSKWKDAKGYGMAKSGHIDLQAHNDEHGGEVWYRNIYIKVL